METRDKVIATIAEVLELPVEDVHPESRFVTDLGANSLDIVNLIWRIEEVFSLPETPESVLEKIETVQHLIEVVSGVRSEESSEVLAGFDVVIASDHAGVELKTQIIQFLGSKKLATLDLGPQTTDSVDYPEFASRVAKRVASEEARFGVLICGTGIGMSIAANKVDGVRAALIHDPVSAKLTRKHNNANVLCLGARITGSELALGCVEAFFSTEFDPGDDGRHQRRVSLISDLEK